MRCLRKEGSGSGGRRRGRWGGVQLGEEWLLALCLVVPTDVRERGKAKMVKRQGEGKGKKARRWMKIGGSVRLSCWERWWSVVLRRETGALGGGSRPFAS